jgi:hypothetical protein
VLPWACDRLVAAFFAFNWLSRSYPERDRAASRVLQQLFLLRPLWVCRFGLLFVGTMVPVCGAARSASMRQARRHG